jgi:hypothetical protein
MEAMQHPIRNTKRDRGSEREDARHPLCSAHAQHGARPACNRESWRVAMTLRLVPVALLLCTSSALAFDTSKLIQFGTLPLDDLTPVIAKLVPLQQEISKALFEDNKKRGDVRCLGMRFPGPWKNLGGLRVSPYTCDFGAKWLQIHATVRITDRHGQAFETITAKAMKNATNVSETNLNWEWTTECGTAPYCAWYVGH